MSPRASPMKLSTVQPTCLIFSISNRRYNNQPTRAAPTYTLAQSTRCPLVYLRFPGNATEFSGIPAVLAADSKLPVDFRSDWTDSTGFAGGKCGRAVNSYREPHGCRRPRLPQPGPARLCRLPVWAQLAGLCSRVPSPPADSVSLAAA